MVSMATVESLVWRKCTPFCEKTGDCPEHHELLQAIVNCTDQLGHLSNLEILKNCVAKYETMGWNKNDDIPDPVVRNRYPLIHWAASLGKCNALEWMINTGFDPTVTVSGVGENALHRAVLCLYKSRAKFTVKELKPKFSKIVSLLSQLLSIPDTVNRDTPLHTAATMLLNTDVRVNFFQTAIEVISTFTQKLSDSERSSILDARNDDGDTALHILAGLGERPKVEFACAAIDGLLQAGADKTIRNNNNQTPLDIAIAKGIDSVIEELVKLTGPLSSSVKSTSPSVHPRTPLSSSGTPHVRSSPRPPVSEQCSIVIGETSGPWTGRDGNDYVMAQVVENGHSGSSSRYRGSPPMVKEEPREDYLHGSHDLDHARLDPSAVSPSPTDPSLFLGDVYNSPLLKHLQEAGLLSEVSSLLLRAKVRDEGQLKRIQQQAKDLDTQIRYKLAEIDKIKSEVDSLHGKRKRCDDEALQLKRRLSSCENAIKEIPGRVPPTSTP